VQEPLLDATSTALALPQTGHKDNVSAGMMWYLTSSFFFTGMGICSKLLGQHGYLVWEITFFRAVVIMACSLTMLISQGETSPIVVVALRLRACHADLRSF
jgi:hypothetical protein